MTLIALLPDLIVLILFALFAIFGGHKGFLLSLAGFLSLVAALVGAKLAADYFTPMLTEYLIPRLEPMVLRQLTLSAEGAVTSGTTSSAGAADAGLGILSLLPGVVDALAAAAQSTLSAMAESITRLLAQMLAWVMLFAGSFLIIKLLCRLICRMLDLLDRLPGLHFLNHALGALFGVLKGGVIISIAVSLLLYFNLLPRELVDGTYLIRLMAQIGSVY